MNDFSTYSDLELLALIKQDSEGAFAEIYERYWEQLIDFGDKILDNKGESEDAVQIVFLDLWQRRYSVQIESLNNFLFQAVRFQIFKVLRTKKQNSNLQKRLIIASSRILGKNPVDLAETKDLLKKMLDSLPEDQRTLLMLYKQEGFTLKEIAKQKNISPKTVEKKIYQALKNLRSNEEVIIVFLLIQVLT
jgi:RNA polymerase sigma-70 factor (ECF subfamily)